MTLLEAKLLVIESKIKAAAAKGETKIAIPQMSNQFEITTLLRLNGFNVMENVYDNNTGNTSTMVEWT